MFKEKDGRVLFNTPKKKRGMSRTKVTVRKTPGGGKGPTAADQYSGIGGYGSRQEEEILPPITGERQTP